MYGSEKTDLIVKYYDIAFGISGEAEVAWYLNQARTSGGPVLDLACGTGRMALLLAKEGFEITAIDQSEGMLNLFREKLKAQSPQVMGRIHIENHKMSEFDLGSRFKTILCCDAFFHNLTVAEEINCLQKVSQHLAPDGRFVFNIPNPTCDYILKSAASGGKQFEPRGRYNVGNGESLLVEQAQAGNLLDQCITTTLRLTRYDGDGNILEQGDSSWISRYLFRYEAVHLLYRCGFEIIALVGDYRNGPVTEKSQLVFAARLQANTAA